MSARRNIYTYVKDHGTREYSREELEKVAQISDWPRVLRQLRQDGILDIEYNPSKSVYDVRSINIYQTQTARAGISNKDRYRIRHRDGHRCQSCGKGVNDGIKLHVDHKIPVEWGGSNLDDNLWTLCEECNLSKKAFFKDDFDAQVMELVFKESSGYKRLKVLFEESPNINFTPSILQGIAGIRDWTRAIRNIRDKYDMNITWFPPNAEFPNGYYVNIE